MIHQSTFLRDLSHVYLRASPIRTAIFFSAAILNYDVQMAKNRDFFLEIKFILNKSK